MSTPTPTNDRELVLQRMIDAAPERVFAAWTQPELLKQWFVPKPWTIAEVRNDLRAGGASLIVMQDTEGNQITNPGRYLEVVQDRKLVFSDAYLGDWQPADKPGYMTAVLTFEPAEGGKTLYTARVRHWSKADCDSHEQRGFHAGWGIATDQLEALLRGE